MRNKNYVMQQVATMYRFWHSQLTETSKLIRSEKTLHSIHKCYTNKYNLWEKIPHPPRRGDESWIGMTRLRLDLRTLIFTTYHPESAFAFEQLLA